MHVMKILLVCLVVCFCRTRHASGLEPASYIMVSADGKWIAYLLADVHYVHLGPEPAPAKQTVYVSWAPTTAPDKVNRAKVAQWGLGESGGLGRDRRLLSNYTHFAFSQEGSRLCVVYPGGLLFLDTRTGESWTCEIKGETPTSLAWLDEENVGYATYSDAKPISADAGKLQRTFWRQRFDQPAGKRQIIRQDRPESSHEGFDWPREYWSPDGRFVIFRDASDRKFASFMTTTSGEVRTMKEWGILSFASWSRDSSRVLVVTQAEHGAGGGEFLLRVATFDHSDLSDEFRKIIGDANPELEPQWTPDDRFVVGRNPKLGGYLVSPEPWSVRLIGQRLKKKPGALLLPTVRSQAAPGILVVEGEGVIIDYDGMIVKELGRGPWTVLPDGKRAMLVEADDKIRLLPLTQ